MMPCEKVLFTKQEALKALKENKKNRHQYRKEQRTYYCQYCNGWHLTSKEKDKPLENVKLKFFKKWKQLFK